MKYKTTWTKVDEIDRKWHLVDIEGQVLGRVATQIAELLMGKAKVERVPNIDCGDHVVIINSSKVELTRGKESKKTYYRHTGFPGGFSEITFEKQMEKNPDFIIKNAVKNMLPKNKLRDGMMLRLHVNPSTTHKNQAQKPVEYKLKSQKNGK